MSIQIWSGPCTYGPNTDLIWNIYTFQIFNDSCRYIEQMKVWRKIYFWYDQGHWIGLDVLVMKRLSVVERAAMLIINDKIYNRKWLTSLNTNKFRFTSIYSICFPSWNLIYGVWYSIIYSNLLIASLKDLYATLLFYES